MEESLLPSGSAQADDSSGGSRSGRRRGGRVERDGVGNNVFGRREGAITGGDRYQKASAMVDQVRSKEGRKKTLTRRHLTLATLTTNKGTRRLRTQQTKQSDRQTDTVE